MNEEKFDLIQEIGQALGEKPKLPDFVVELRKCFCDATITILQNGSKGTEIEPIEELLSAFGSHQDRLDIKYLPEELNLSIDADNAETGDRIYQLVTLWLEKQGFTVYSNIVPCR